MKNVKTIEVSGVEEERREGEKEKKIGTRVVMEQGKGKGTGHFFPTLQMVSISPPVKLFSSALANDNDRSKKKRIVNRSVLDFAYRRANLLIGQSHQLKVEEEKKNPLLKFQLYANKY